jgi:hypothetical protein
MLSFNYSFDIVVIPCMFEPFRNAPHRQDTYNTKRFFLFSQMTISAGLKDWVNKPWRVTNELEILSQVNNFMMSVFFLLAYGVGFNVQALNYPFFTHGGLFKVVSSGLCGWVFYKPWWLTPIPFL